MVQVNRLQERVALVTGVGERPAGRVALALGGAGASVMAVDVNPNRAEAAADGIRKAGGRALAWTADLSNKFQVGAMIEHVRDEFGGLHIVVNGWTVNKRGPFLTLDEYDWRRVLEVNLTGAFFLSQMTARVMVDESGGVIVHLLAIVPPGSTGQVPYQVCQAGLAALSSALMTELGPLGVRVAAVTTAEDDDRTVDEVLRLLSETG